MQRTGHADLASEQVLFKSASGWPEPARIIQRMRMRQLAWRRDMRPFFRISPRLVICRDRINPACILFWADSQASPNTNKTLQTTYAKQAVVTLPNGVALASALVLLVREPLLRFRTVMAFKPSRSLQVTRECLGKGYRRFAALSPVFASAQFGLRHFGIVVVHVWATRLALVVLCVVLIELPMVLATTFVLPNAGQIAPNLPVLPYLAFVQASAAALLVRSGKCLALCTTRSYTWR